MAKLTQLISSEELTVGQIGAIRNMVTKNLLALASKELKMPTTSLIARDIRPQSDLDWASDANATDGLASSAVTTDIWQFTTDASLTGWLSCIVSASRVMGDQRFMAIYGMRDSRMSMATPTAVQCTMWKIIVGNSVKSIWDTEKLNAYRKNISGFTPSAVVVPQNAQWDIYGYLPAAAGSVVTYVNLEGVIVEPRGKVVSP